MDGFSILDKGAWDSAALLDTHEYAAGNALGWLHHSNKQASTNHALVGRLYVAKSGWLLLSVPNALVRGVYDAMSATGAELPRAGLLNVPNVAADVLNAHISVMTAAEVEKIGIDNINERGHMFGYSLGQLKEITPRNIDGISKVWAIQVSAPALSALRKSYGLSPLPKDQPFHITVAVRRKGVLNNNTVSKAAADKTPQPRVRVVMPYKNQYLMETLNNSKWPENIGKRRFIGGGIEEGETPEQAAAREMFEELGVKIKPTAFKPLGNDPREGWQHEHYLELLKHKLKPGNFNATVGSDAVVTLSHGLPEGDDYMGPDIKKLLAPALKTATDLTKLAPKWSDRAHILAALPKHLSDTQSAISTNGDVDKEMTDLALIAKAWLKSQRQRELLSARLKKFQETAAYPPLVAQKTAAGKLSRSGQKDLLPGGTADNLPDREFSSSDLAEGAEHEREHTDNDQVAKEIAKDHLQEDSSYYEKVKQIEKASASALIKDLRAAKEHSDQRRFPQKHEILRRLMEQSPQDWRIDDPKPHHKGVTHTPTKFRFHTDPTTIPDSVRAALKREKAAAPRNSSVYAQQLYNMYNLRRPLRYDFNKSFLDNVHDTARDVKSQGDFRLQADRNYQKFLAARDPNYRYQLAVKAMNNELEEPALVDQVINRYGDSMLNTAFGVPK